ncbi:MAG: peptide-N-glycosidase [Bacteroidetes bacterium]|nr:peptide-N-glycosidase [Bacteroidota bacterium]
MKRILLILVLIFATMMASAQQRLVYQSYMLGSDSGDTTFREVLRYKNQLKINDIQEFDGELIQGLSTDYTFVDYDADSAYFQMNYQDGESYFYAYSLKTNDIEFEEVGSEKVKGYNCKKYKTSINSNTIEVWMTESLGYDASPVTSRGYLKGVMVRQAINGNRIMDLKSVKKDKKLKKGLIPDNLGVRKSGRELNNIQKEKLIIRTRIFDDDQIHFVKMDKFQGEIPFDTVIHFSWGTIILKRVNLPVLPEHYQIFAELHQRSNGDAYDRSGSIFVIPMDRKLSLCNALIDSIEVIPYQYDKNGKKYQGIRLEDDYMPVVELMRFFTPFGVNHFNDRVQLDGLEWADEAYYKMEVSELSDRLQGDVLIGAFIGNYDGGGHKVSLDLVAYPQDYDGDVSKNDRWSLPLFNTCNVMEMSGQNYGRLFQTDSLTVEFDIPEGVENLKLRYITTGHGGWGGGDEFNPKEYTIIIDGEKVFRYTPWRCDCATYRELNPVSGNFWNGVSSSDLSRSGWCPGTATNPVYFDLSDLKPGHHTITVAIPQGEDEGGSFSHWMVSGVLVGSF